MSAGERTLDTTASARPSAATRETAEAPPPETGGEPPGSPPPAHPPGGKPADIHTLTPGAEREQLAVIPTTDEEHGAVGQNRDAVGIPEMGPPGHRRERPAPAEAVHGIGARRTERGGEPTLGGVHGAV